MKPFNRNKLFSIALIILIGAGLVLLALVSTASQSYGRPWFGHHHTANGTDLQRFSSEAELVEAFTSIDYPEPIYYKESMGSVSGRITSPTNAAGLPQPVMLETDSASAGDFSTTNIQVAGVDEADIVKTDGSYVYLVSKNKLIIVKAHPPGEAQIVSETTFDSFSPAELFIKGDRLLVIGTASPYSEAPKVGAGSTAAPTYWPVTALTSARLYDISSRGNPRLIKTADIEGSYDTSRLIGDYAYLVVNTYRYINNDEALTAGNITPLCREDSGAFQPVAKASDIYYLPPLTSPSFVTVCSIDMSSGATEKETIAGTSGTVYVSQENLYFTRSDSEYYYYDYTSDESTTIVKLHLKQGKIEEAGSGTVPGHLLNQFSMDETGGYFRVATTRGSLFDTQNPSTNNIYVLDDKMNRVGSLEGLAPGEKIYSARFMGSKCYLVTFKKVDPLFVIDLSDPKNPKVLGKLKIPGYSDYLQPYDENHIIGIGKDAVDASEGEVSSRGLDFAWYQGVKMALFDVSDVEHPKELYKVVIGDRGTDSPVLTDHRALLFDREKGLLVLPVSVAEIKGEKTADNQYGEVVFTGAYVYDINLSEGFTLRGKVTHYDSEDGLQKDNYYYYYPYGDRAIQRSLYIGNVLYTLSQSRLQLNDLNSLEKLKALEL